MLSQNNEYLQEVVSGVRQLTEEEKIRQQCEAREINAYWERIREAAHKQELADKDQQLADKDKLLADKNKLLTEKNAEIELLLAEIATLKQQSNQ